MKFVMVRREVLEQLRASPEWEAKLDNAKTVDEKQQVIVDFCKAHSWEVVTIEEPGVAG